jgi:hypothetical protein
LQGWKSPHLEISSTHWPVNWPIRVLRKPDQIARYARYFKYTYQSIYKDTTFSFHEDPKCVQGHAIFYLPYFIDDIYFIINHMWSLILCDRVLTEEHEKV